MLQRLEFADGHPELFAGFQVVQRRLVQRRHDAHRLGAERCDGPSTARSMMPSASPRRADHGILLDFHILELEIARPGRRD